MGILYSCMDLEAGWICVQESRVFITYRVISYSGLNIRIDHLLRSHRESMRESMRPVFPEVMLGVSH